MKKLLRAILAAALLLSLAACGGDGASAPRGGITSTGKTVDDVLGELTASQAPEVTQEPSATPEAPEATQEPSATPEASAAPEPSATPEVTSTAQPVQEATPAPSAGTAPVATPTPAPTPTPTPTPQTLSVDVDLTVLSSTMVYSEVYNMMVSPSSYVGKVVKMSGQFYPYTNQEQSQYYPACVIQDATACCAQGIEFLLAGTDYPTGYPAAGASITVVGTFETYLEDGYLYCHLVDAQLS